MKIIQRVRLWIHDRIGHPENAMVQVEQFMLRRCSCGVFFSDPERHPEFWGLEWGHAEVMDELSHSRIFGRIWR